MKDARLYNCALCHAFVTICSCCDRGNIYCSDACTEQARKVSLRFSNKRYQSTYRGKLNHAAAQKRYRAHIKIKKQKVTDHSSQPPYNVLLLMLIAIVAKETAKAQRKAGIYCYFCDKLCSAYLRRGFLRVNRGVTVASKTNLGQAP